MFGCEYCHGLVKHNPRCPKYIPPKACCYCSICGDGIYGGEEYIVNDSGDYAHWDCVSYGRDLTDFLGYKIKMMEGGDEE